MNIFVSHSVATTHKFGISIAQELTGSETIFLRGDLAAGKTAFAHGLAKGLSIYDPIISPTFPIIIEYYSGKYPLFHMDLYRLSHYDEFVLIAGEDYLNSPGICLIEWPHILDEFAIYADYEITIKATGTSSSTATDEQERIFSWKKNTR